MTAPSRLPDPRLAEAIWRPYIEDIALACAARQPEEDAALVAAIGLRETILGTVSDYIVPPGAPRWMGTGDHGHGRGLFQIDDRGPFSYLIPRPGEGWTPFVQACSAIAVLEDARRSLELEADDPLHERGVVAAYNCGAGVARTALRAGKDPDFWTTGRNYGRDVLSLRDGLRALFPETFPLPAVQALAAT